jgi:hypothetical protein
MHPDACFVPQKMAVALMERQRFRGVVWEPACGDGAISEVVNAYGLPVVSSDLCVDYGLPGAVRLNFLTQRPRWWFDNIITNPPFRGYAIGPWIERACSYSPERVALMFPVHVLSDLPRWATGRMRLRRVIQLPRFAWRHADGRHFGQRWGICWYVWEFGFTGSPVVQFALPE